LATTSEAQTADGAYIDCYERVTSFHDEASGLVGYNEGNVRHASPLFVRDEADQWVQ
jgi:hypothetical protein